MKILILFCFSFLVFIFFQATKEEFSEWVCNYCQLQLEMFNGFVTKAKQSNELFEEIALEIETLDESIEEDDSRVNKIKCEEWNYDDNFDGFDEAEEIDEPQNIEELWIENGTLCIEPAENEIKADADDDADADAHADVVPDDGKIFKNQISFSSHLIQIFVRNSDFSFVVEFLDQDNESTENIVESDKMVELEVQKNPISKKLKKGQPKRYSYRCNQCKKRFIYKDVYEAHLRTHQGLPGWKLVK